MNAEEGPPSQATEDALKNLEKAIKSHRSFKEEYDARKKQKLEKRAAQREAQMRGVRSVSVMGPGSMAQHLTSRDAAISRGFQGLAQDIADLQHNDNEIASALDLNFRAFAKILAKLGVTDEQLREAMKEATDEFNAEMLRRQQDAEAARRAQERAKADAAEKTKIETAVDEGGVPAEAPEAATVFGG